MIAADLAARSVVVARALIANSSRRLRQDELLRAWANTPAAEGALQRPMRSLPERLLGWAASREEPVRSLVQLVAIKLVLGSFPLSIPDATDAGAVAQGDFDRVSPRRLGHYLRARERLTPAGVWATARAVNAGVFVGHGTALQGDARELLANTPADIVYLDPPYAGTTGYERSYRRLDALLGDDSPGGAALSLPELLEAFLRADSRLS